MRRAAAALVVLAGISSPALSWAQAACDEARAVRGAVTEVRLSAGQVRLPSGEATKAPELTERWTYLADRRRITIVQYGSAMFSFASPTTLCEYDQGSRLTKQTFKRNGWTEYEVTTFQYDAKGRMLVRDTRSKDAGRSGSTTFEYGDTTVTERSPAGDYTTRQLDAQGQVLKEVTHRTANGVTSSSTTRYERNDGVVTACPASGQAADCQTSRYDRWGNLLEERVGQRIAATYTYDVDVRGNWVKRVAAKYVDGKPPATADVTIREIVYRP